jgi:hypothetical protein
MRVRCPERAQPAQRAADHVPTTMVKAELVSLEQVERVILLIRGHRVMLDSDLARLYGVTVKALNQAVSRNIERFPADFMLRLTLKEARRLRSQFVTLDVGRGGTASTPPMRSPNRASPCSRPFYGARAPCR